MHTVAAAAGLALVLFTFAEVFEALVLPRRVLRPLGFTRLYYQTAWRAWVAAAHLLPVTRRQTFLCVFAPLSLLALFALWAAALILGFGLIHYSLGHRPGILSDAVYLSGATFTTLGYGDLTPGTPPARVLAVAEAATGFGFFAVVVSYLPVLYQAFSRREAFVGLLDARAGSPPAAGRMLLRTPSGGDGGACLTAFLTEGERWAAEVLEGHLAFPVLGYYRSQHDNQSWLAALACTLDASALLMTVVDGAGRTQARLTFAMARHAVVDLGLDLRLPPVREAVGAAGGASGGRGAGPRRLRSAEPAGRVAGAVRAVRGRTGRVLPAAGPGGVAGGRGAGQLADERVDAPGRSTGRPGCGTRGRPLRLRRRTAKQPGNGPPGGRGHVDRSSATTSLTRCTGRTTGSSPPSPWCPG